MKKGWICFILSLFLFTACMSNASFVMKKGVTKKGNQKLEGTYAYFHGYKEYVFFAKNGDYNFHITTHTKEGNLRIWVNGKVFEMEKESEEKIEKMEVSDKRITIKVEGEEHMGDFLITWEKTDL